MRKDCYAALSSLQEGLRVAPTLVALSGRTGALLWGDSGDYQGKGKGVSRAPGTLFLLHIDDSVNLIELEWAEVCMGFCADACDHDRPLPNMLGVRRVLVAVYIHLANTHVGTVQASTRGRVEKGVRTRSQDAKAEGKEHC